MSNTQKIQWQRLLVEGAAIVASILLAFAIDAWWDNRLERIEERRVLESLKAEFLSNAEKIPWFIDSHQKSADSALEVLNAMSAAKSDKLLRLPAAKIARVLGHNSTTLRSGALDATLQSGDLRYITNSTIRERLSAWPTLVMDATENEDLLRNLWDPKLLEALAKDVDLTKIDAVDDVCWDDPTLEECAAMEIILPRNTEVMAYLRVTGSYAAEGARELGILVEEANDIVILIDQELATR
jgi:hypothetical protein